MRVPADKISLPIPDLDDKTFDELFVEARALIPRYAPQWTDHNTSDLGITFIELFAWLTEMQIYSLNRINDQNILKYIKLLGEAPRSAISAKVTLAFAINEYRTNPVIIKKGSQASVIDSLTDLPLVFETNSDLIVTKHSIAHLFVDDSTRFIDITEENKSNGIYAFVFGENALPNSAFYIAFSGSDQFNDAKIKLYYNHFDADLPRLNVPELQADIVPSALLEWQYWDGSNWMTLAVEDDTVALTRSGSISFNGHDDFKKAALKIIIPGVINPGQDELFWLRTVVREAGYEIPPRINTLIANAVVATQQETITGENIPSAEIERQGLPFQTASLKTKPILENSLSLKIKEQNQVWQQWTTVADFDASAPNDRHYTIDLKEGLIRFGDGLKGRIPPQCENNETNIRANYKVGGGETGNVKAQTLKTIQSFDATVVKVDNPLPAFGGSQTESLEAVQHRIRKDLKQAYRSVNCDDFSALAIQTPGLRIQRVKVLPLYHPNFPAIKMPGAVTVIVVPVVLATQSGLPIPSKGFLATIYNYLEQRRLVATRLSVIGAKFVKVSIKASVEIEQGKSAELLLETIKEKVNTFFHPIKGGADSEGWAFGRNVYRSEVYQLIQNIEGIRCVKNIDLSAEKCFCNKNGGITLPQIGLVDLDSCKVVINGVQNR